MVATSPQTPQDHLELLSPLRSRISEDINFLFGLLAQTDHTLDFYGSFLLQTQPKLTGRITFTWRTNWHRSQDDDTQAGHLRTPVFMKWTRSKGGRWRAVRIATNQVRKHLHSSGLFSSGYPTTSKIIDRMLVLLEIRARVMELFRKLKITTTYIAQEAEHVLDQIQKAPAEMESLMKAMPPLRLDPSHPAYVEVKQGFGH